ncbi:MAG: hypothetical protein O7I42_18335 [Alphaproteobacteria bacterium]|nr:hypothetical protein [Alphaproteobacteria bacterium]
MRLMGFLLICCLVVGCQTTQQLQGRDKAAKILYAQCASNRYAFPSEEQRFALCRCVIPIAIDYFKPELLNAIGQGKPWRGSGGLYTDEKAFEISAVVTCPNSVRLFHEFEIRSIQDQEFIIWPRSYPIQGSDIVRNANKSAACEGFKNFNPGLIAEAKRLGLNEESCAQILSVSSKNLKSGPYKPSQEFIIRSIQGSDIGRNANKSAVCEGFKNFNPALIAEAKRLGLSKESCAQ